LTDSSTTGSFSTWLITSAFVILPSFPLPWILDGFSSFSSIILFAAGPDFISSKWSCEDSRSGAVSLGFSSSTNLSF
tara:strand:- start:33 stop:263 length:231 start_codon:yes stop_codon:yes gene_type:complete